MITLTLPCDTDAGDTVTLARIGGCAGVTVRAKQHQVNLTPADARQAAAWLVACADEVEASLARVRAEEVLEPTATQGLCTVCGVAVGERINGLCSVCHEAGNPLAEVTP